MTQHTPDFADYEFEVSIVVRRKTDRYSGDTLASVQTTQQQTMRSGDVDTVLDSIARETVSKARTALGIKHGYEAEVRALAAGSDTFAIEA